MKRIGKKIDGVNYSKRPGSYVIVTRKNDKKIAKFSNAQNVKTIDMFI